jgi:hypothetical protein
MVQQLLNLLPQDRVAEFVFSFVVFGAVMGLATLFLGSLRRRAAATLMLMCLGILMGRGLHAWYGWGGEPNATAILGAVVGGVLGFLLHRLWIAIGLGVVAALLAACVLWFQLEAARQVEAPRLEAGMGLLDHLSLCWSRVPEDFQSVLPLVTAPAFLIFAVFGFVFVRLGSAMFFATAGAMVLAASLLLGETSGHMPQIGSMLPQLIELRVLLFAAVVLLGTLVQWLLVKPDKARKKPAAAPEDDS